MNAQIWMFPVLCVAEIGILCLAGFLIFLHLRHSFAEAASYACISSLMLLSFSFQTAFIMGTPVISWGIEAIAAFLSIAAIIRFRNQILRVAEVVRYFGSEHRGAAAALFVCWSYLAIQSAVLPADPCGWFDLSNILLYQQDHSFFTETAGQSLFPANSGILSHLFLRFGTGCGTGVFGFLAYLSIGFSTYALARRYAWPPTALTVALVAVSMPRLVCHATTSGTELIPAAASVFCLLAVNRAVERPNIRDFIFIFLGILFSISGDATGLVFPAILTALAIILLFRRHGSAAWKDLVTSRPLAIVAALPFAAVFSQVWLYAFNAMYREEWIGSLPGSSPNPDGIVGALANLCRYLVESVHLTKPADFVCRHTIGFSPQGFLQGVYDRLAVPILGQNGAVSEFALNWAADAHTSWFGPMGGFLILPAILFALVRGHRRLKSIAIAIVGYLYIITFASAWMPGNARFFTVFFVCGAVCSAAFLPPWRLTRRGRQFLQTASVLILVYACACNTLKPIMGIRPALSGIKALAAGDTEQAEKLFRKSAEQSWTNRHNIAGGPPCFSRFFGDGRVDEFASLVPRKSEIAIVAKDISLAYPFIARLGDSRFSLYTMNESVREYFFDFEKYNFVLFVDGSPQFVPDGFTKAGHWTLGEKETALFGRSDG